MQEKQQEAAARYARILLARRHLWEYCRLMAPEFYTEDRLYLKDMCDTFESFYESDTELLVVNLPP